MLLQSRYTSSAKYDAKHMLSYLDFHCYFEANVSDNSSCAQPPPPPPGYCRAFARFVSPGGGAFANLALPGGRAFANPRANPELLTRTRFPLTIKLHTEDFTGKTSRWARFSRTGKKVFKGMLSVLCMHFFMAYQARIT